MVNKEDAMQLCRSFIARLGLLGRSRPAAADAFDDRLSRIGLREARRSRTRSVVFRCSHQPQEA